MRCHITLLVPLGAHVQKGIHHLAKTRFHLTHPFFDSAKINFTFIPYANTCTPYAPARATCTSARRLHIFEGKHIAEREQMGDASNLNEGSNSSVYAWLQGNRPDSQSLKNVVYNLTVLGDLTTREWARQKGDFRRQKKNACFAQESAI